jgi:hypothetical protein
MRQNYQNTGAYPCCIRIPPDYSCRVLSAPLRYPSQLPTQATAGLRLTSAQTHLRTLMVISPPPPQIPGPCTTTSGAGTQCTLAWYQFGCHATRKRSPRESTSICHSTLPEGINVNMTAWRARPPLVGAVRRLEPLCVQCDCALHHAMSPFHLSAAAWLAGLVSQNIKIQKMYLWRTECVHGRARL